MKAIGGSFTLGRFTLQPRRQLLCDGRPIAIGGKALDLLSLLAEARGDLVTKDELMAGVWPGIVVEENAIQVHMSAARRALAEEADRLVTVRGRGYRLDVEASIAPTQTGTSLAVLAFANLTGDPDKDYLSDGIAEELITTLSRFSDLRIPSRTSTFVYKHRDTDIRTIARDLDVTMVLEGSVRTAGERIRVTVQLIEASSGFHLWAQNFDRILGDLLALHDELAAAIGRILQTRINGSSRTDDPVAYALYLQGRGLAGQMSPESIGRAISLHRQAIASDPRFARAWAGLAGTLMVGTTTGLLPPERRGEAEDAVAQAIRLDPGAAAPYAIRAALDAGIGRWIEAADDFGMAAELDPDEPVALDAMALSLWAPAGHLLRCLDLADRAAELAPATANLRLGSAFCSLINSRHEEARTHLEMATLLGVQQARSLFQAVRAELALHDGDVSNAAGAYAAILEAASEFRNIGAADCAAHVVAALAGSGDRDEALAAALSLFSRARERRWQSSSAPGQLIRWLTLLGQVDAAHDVASKLVDDWRAATHFTMTSMHHLWRSDMGLFRDHPRFMPLVDALGFLPLWARHGPPDGYRLSGATLIAKS